MTTKVSVTEQDILQCAGGIVPCPIDIALGRLVRPDCVVSTGTWTVDLMVDDESLRMIDLPPEARDFIRTHDRSKGADARPIEFELEIPATFLTAK